MKAMMVIAVAAALAPLSGSWLSNHKTPLIVAHRGASHDAPENTLAAFNLAWQQKADAIEGDFYLTKDGRIVCIHDGTTGRTAGVDLPVERSGLRELRQLDVGSWKGTKWTGEKIPTIEEVFTTIPKGKKIYIHVKCGPEIFPALKKAIGRSDLKPSQIDILTSDKTVIAEAKKQLPEIAVFWLTDYRCDAQAKQGSPQFIEAVKRTKAEALSINAEAAVDSAFMDELRRNKVELHVWNVDNLTTIARFWRLGAASLTTDHPGWFRFLARS